jgi:hypothetical protein
MNQTAPAIPSVFRPIVIASDTQGVKLLAGPRQTVRSGFKTRLVRGIRKKVLGPTDGRFADLVIESIGKQLATEFSTGFVRSLNVLIGAELTRHRRLRTALFRKHSGRRWTGYANGHEASPTALVTV